MKDLESSTLNLVDLEVTEDEVPLLCEFLSSKIVIRDLSTLILSKIAATSFSVHKYRKNPDGSQNYHALNVDGNRLFKAAIAFVGKSAALKTLILDSVKLDGALVGLLAESLSVTTSGRTNFGNRQYLFKLFKYEFFLL